MIKLVTLQATYRIVTPMFLGGAEPEKSVELRTPSIKAALRFWWRAIKWAQIKPSSPDNRHAIAALHEQEAKLFGSADAGQSQVLLQVKHVSNISEIKKGGVLTKVVIDPVTGTDRPGARYLGYGVMEAFRRKNRDTEKVIAKAGELTRTCIDCGAEFTLEVCARASIDQDVINALKLLGLLGGLGSKVRKGYGSLTLIRLTGDVPTWEAVTTEDAYIKALKDLLSFAGALMDKPPFSAFSKKSRVCRLLERDDPLTVLDDYGRQMQRYRSWGKDRIVNGKKSEQNFADDHKWYRKQKHDAVVLLPKQFHPQRVVFGLPHNYGKGPKLEVTPEKKTAGMGYDRRASPLWFHVHDYDSGANPRYAGVSTVFRAKFLPDGERINVGGVNVPAKANYSFIDTLLDGAGRSASSSTAPVRYFPDARKVFP